MMWLALIVTVAGVQSSAADVSVRIEHSPADVASFINRRIDCNHWVGEVFPNGFPPRQREVRKVLRSLRCSRVDQDGQRLEAKYRSNAEVMSLLRETADMLPEDFKR